MYFYFFLVTLQDAIYSVVSRIIECEICEFCQNPYGRVDTTDYPVTVSSVVG